MPVRSLSSSVIVWPNVNEVEQRLSDWAYEVAKVHPELLGVGYYGSYSSGNWGVGSDLDVVLIVKHSNLYEILILFLPQLNLAPVFCGVKVEA